MKTVWGWPASPFSGNGSEYLRLSSKFSTEVVSSLWRDTIPDSRRQSLMARLEARRQQLAALEADAREAQGSIARTLFDVQVASVRRAIAEIESELAAT